MATERAYCPKCNRRVNVRRNDPDDPPHFSNHHLPPDSAYKQFREMPLCDGSGTYVEVSHAK